MDSTEGFEAFVTVVDAGSISEAARTLGMPRATLSRQLARLEDRLGVRLMHRQTRSLPLTRAGQELYRRARPVVEAGRAALEAVARLDDVPRGLLRVAGPPDGELFHELLFDYLRAYPEVRLEFTASNRHVDLAAEGIDVAIRAGRVHDPGLIARPLVRMDSVLVASPAYLEAHGTPSDPCELQDHACIRGFVAGTKPEAHWPTPEGRTVAVCGRFTSDDLTTRIHAARAGLGITHAPRPFVAADLETGVLVPVLEGRVGVDGGIHAVYVEREHLDPKIRAFVDTAVTWFADHFPSGTSPFAGRGPAAG